MDTRESLNIMRNLKKGVIENKPKPKNERTDKKKDMTMRDMLKITRDVVNETPVRKAINEADMERIDLNQDGTNDSNLIDTAVDSKKTMFDQESEEEKFRQALDRFNVNINFMPIEILDNSITWGGTIDNQLEWHFLVTQDETKNGVRFKYSQNFDDSKPDNQEMVEAIESYYNDFYKYWRDNELRK